MGSHMIDLFKNLFSLTKNLKMTEAQTEFKILPMPNKPPGKI